MKLPETGGWEREAHFFESGNRLARRSVTAYRSGLKAGTGMAAELYRNARGAMHPLRAVLFDKDGTLVDYERTWAPINRKAAALAAAGDASLEKRLLDLCGVDPGTGRTRPDSLFAAGTAASIADAMAAAGSPVERRELTAALDALFVSAAELAVPVCDTPALFRDLHRRGLRIGIASNDSELSVQRTADALCVASLADFLCGYDSGHGAKPGPGMVTGFAAAAGVTPGEVAVIGDSVHDMAMGRMAGAGVLLGVLSGAGTRETLAPHCDACIDSVADLPAWLDAVRDRTAAR